MLKTEAYAVHNSLKACPFCGRMLVATVRGGGDVANNPKARCMTVGCYATKFPVLSLDIKEDVEAWNARADI